MPLWKESAQNCKSRATTSRSAKPAKQSALALQVVTESAEKAFPRDPNLVQNFRSNQCRHLHQAARMQNERMQHPNMIPNQEQAGRLRHSTLHSPRPRPKWSEFPTGIPLLNPLQRPPPPLMQAPEPSFPFFWTHSPLSAFLLPRSCCLRSANDALKKQLSNSSALFAGAEADDAKRLQSADGRSNGIDEDAR